MKSENFKNMKDQSVFVSATKDPYQELDSIVKNYQQAHEDKETINQLVTRFIYSQAEKEIKKAIGVRLFNKEAAIHKNDETEIYNCLHNSFYPKVARAFRKTG